MHPGAKKWACHAHKEPHRRPDRLPSLTPLRCHLPLPAGLFLQENLKYDQFGQLMEGVAGSAVLASSPSSFLAYLEVSVRGRQPGVVCSVVKIKCAEQAAWRAFRDHEVRSLTGILEACLRSIRVMFAFAGDLLGCRRSSRRWHPGRRALAACTCRSVRHAVHVLLLSMHRHCWWLTCQRRLQNNGSLPRSRSCLLLPCISWCACTLLHLHTRTLLPTDGYCIYAIPI